MLTGDVIPTVGESDIVGYDVKKEFDNARKQIGYCPQFDAIFDLMTVREHLEFYCKIKKIPKEYQEDLISKQLKDMNLQAYENKQSGSLSGGNKRKLSVAMAMIGNPPVVFLDEPSAGMDPKARKFMWEVIAKISTQRKNSAVILTTHSMEEAEALSTNMGIMVDGQFKCFGSKQHIKNKFGTGYQVEVKFLAPKLEELEEKVESLKISDFLGHKKSKHYKKIMIRGAERIVVDRETSVRILKDLLQNNTAADEFEEKKFGAELIEVLKRDQYISVIDLIKWEIIVTENLKLVSKLVDILMDNNRQPRYPC
jgi:ATP-binding cassette subfamily A (ABC1) protein 3